MDSLRNLISECQMLELVWRSRENEMISKKVQMAPKITNRKAFLKKKKKWPLLQVVLKVKRTLVCVFKGSFDLTCSPCAYIFFVFF